MIKGCVLSRDQGMCCYNACVCRVIDREKEAFFLRSSKDYERPSRLSFDKLSLWQNYSTSDVQLARFLAKYPLARSLYVCKHASKRVSGRLPSDRRICITASLYKGQGTDHPTVQSLSLRKQASKQLRFQSRDSRMIR